MRFIWPLENHYITRGFDFKSNIYIGGQHAAVDLVRLQGDTTGRPIKASASGTIVGDDFNSISGYYIVIGHKGGWRTTYRHLVTDAPPTIGDQIAQGQVIGNVGSTGWSTGPHLHFDLWHIDKQDPTAFPKVGWWAHNPELYLGIESVEPTPEPEPPIEPEPPEEESMVIVIIKAEGDNTQYILNTDGRKYRLGSLGHRNALNRLDAEGAIRIEYRELPNADVLAIPDEHA